RTIERGADGIVRDDVLDLHGEARENVEVALALGAVRRLAVEIDLLRRRHRDRRAGEEQTGCDRERRRARSSPGTKALRHRATPHARARPGGRSPLGLSRSDADGTPAAAEPS